MQEPVFFKAARPMTAGEVARATGASLGDASHESIAIEGVASVEDAGPAMLVYVDDKRMTGLLEGSPAAAVLCRQNLADTMPAHMAVLVSKNPKRDFAVAGRLLFPESARPGPMSGETGISPGAHIHEGARLEDGVVVEAGAVIGPGVEIGSGTVIAPNAVIGADCRIGRDGYIGAGATLACALIGDRVIIHTGVRIGQDGFGYVAGPAGPEKVPQLGRVIIQDDVEIGANTTVDRGGLADTVIGQGTKIDNLVQIAHNVTIGRFCIVAGYCGISGSVTIGDGVIMGGNVGVADHVKIGSGVTLAGRSGVTQDVPAGARWGGFPAQPARAWLRETLALKKLAEQRRSGKEGDD